jgi:copper chaperone CopZ
MRRPSIIGLILRAFRTDTFAVDGMTCGSCVQHVESALLQREDVKKAKVNLKAATVKVTFSRGTDVNSLFDEVRDVGYQMGPLQPKSS